MRDLRNEKEKVEEFVEKHAEIYNSDKLPLVMNTLS